jgi:predicted DCC family thiol-disulfide oxidoreductase YuxK
VPALTAFFEAETGARPIAVCRVAVGLASLARAGVQYRFLRALLGGEVIRAKHFEWMPDLPAGLVGPLVAAWMLLSLLFAAGLCTRSAGSLLVALLAYQLALDGNLYANNLYLLMLLVLLLTVADSGRSLSLDRRFFRADAAVVARWSTLLPRLQVSLVYFFSALVKLNPTFLAGHPIRQMMRMPAGLADTWVLVGAAIGTVIMEFFLSAALWIPKLRRAAFAGGLALHACIIAGMPRSMTTTMITFAVTTLAPFVLFLEHPPGSRLVIWDDRCGFCRGWIALFRALDWLKIHRFAGSSDPTALAQAGITAEDADAELKLCFDGRVLGGFDAVREVLCVLPLSFLWAPVLALPPVRAAGVRCYGAVAARRKCTYAA